MRGGWRPDPDPAAAPLQGGSTRFDLLNLAVRPEKGTALLFFPAFADGTSDPRWARLMAGKESPSPEAKQKPGWVGGQMGWLVV